MLQICNRPLTGPQTIITLNSESQTMWCSLSRMRPQYLVESLSLIPISDGKSALSRSLDSSTFGWDISPDPLWLVVVGGVVVVVGGALVVVGGELVVVVVLLVSTLVVVVVIRRVVLRLQDPFLLPRFGFLDFFGLLDFFGFLGRLIRQ